jgi:hypothetical protein
MPSWKSRECSLETGNCAGHGKCVESSCNCDEGYYGLKNPQSCDTYCFGEIFNGVCRNNRTYYVGAQLDYDVEHFRELSAHLRLAVELVNNKTDGWFDDNTKQVTLKIRLNNSACDAETALAMLHDQQQWAYNTTKGTIAFTSIY